MKILILSEHYWPEIGAASNRITYMARFLALKGHDVTVICPAPNYPEGKLYKGWRNRFFSRMKDGEVNIIRTWMVVNRGGSFFPRILHYVSFMTTAFFAALGCGKPDILVVTSPPLFIGISGVLLSRIWRVPFAFDVRDIWPESAVVVGMMRKGFFFGLAEKIEKLIYRTADHITVTAKGIQKNIVAKGIAESKISFVPNGAELDFFYPIDDGGRARLKNEMWLTNTFVVLYGGNIGMAQNPGVLVDCAKLLPDQSNIMFLVAGGGVQREVLENEAKEMGLKNIRFLGQIERNEMKRIYGVSDVGFILYKKSDLFANVLPAKLFDMWSAGLPIIINLAGEAAELIERSQSGMVAASEDPAALKNAILKMMRNPEQRKEMGKNGRMFAEQYFDREKIAEQFENILFQTKRGV